LVMTGDKVSEKPRALWRTRDRWERPSRGPQPDGDGGSNRQSKTRGGQEGARGERLSRLWLGETIDSTYSGRWARPRTRAADCKHWPDQNATEPPNPASPVREYLRRFAPCVSPACSYLSRLDQTQTSHPSKASHVSQSRLDSPSLAPPAFSATSFAAYAFLASSMRCCRCANWCLTCTRTSANRAAIEQHGDGTRWGQQDVGKKSRLESWRMRCEIRDKERRTMSASCPSTTCHPHAPRISTIPTHLLLVVSLL
jgi:hypothetical protein